MDSLEQLSPTDQSALQGLLGNSGGSLIPESLVTTLTISFIVLNVLGVLFTIFYIAGIIRKWKVQSAVLHMQKDLVEIKQALAARPQPVQPQPAPVSEPIVQPTLESPNNNIS